MAVSHAG